MYAQSLLTELLSVHAYIDPEQSVWTYSHTQPQAEGRIIIAQCGCLTGQSIHWLSGSLGKSQSVCNNTVY